MVSGTLEYGRALSICVGMFFVIVFSHIDLRQRLAAQEIFYPEYFYFTIYAAIRTRYCDFACLYWLRFGYFTDRTRGQGLRITTKPRSGAMHQPLRRSTAASPSASQIAPTRHPRCRSPSAPCTVGTGHSAAHG